MVNQKKKIAPSLTPSAPDGSESSSAGLAPHAFAHAALAVAAPAHQPDPQPNEDRRLDHQPPDPVDPAGGAALDGAPQSVPRVLETLSVPLVVGTGLVRNLRAPIGTSPLVLGQPGGIRRQGIKVMHN